MIEKETIDLIWDIIEENSDINKIYIHSYPTPGGIEDRLHFSALEQKHFNEAIKIRNSTKVGFWESLMLTFFDKDEISEEILYKMLNHHSKRNRFPIERFDVLNKELHKYRNSNENYALNSMVETTDGEKRHLILLDFHIPENTKNQVVVECLLDALGLKSGYLIRSGKSYHYMSDYLVKKEVLNKILHKAIFYSPIIDKYWIAHQLLSKSSSIRISMKNGVYPLLIKRY